MLLHCSTELLRPKLVGRRNAVLHRDDLGIASRVDQQRPDPSHDREQHLAAEPQPAIRVSVALGSTPEGDCLERVECDADAERQRRKGACDDSFCGIQPLVRHRDALAESASALDRCPRYVPDATSTGGRILVVLVGRVQRDVGAAVCVNKAMYTDVLTLNLVQIPVALRALPVEVLWALRGKNAILRHFSAHVLFETAQAKCGFERQSDP